MFNKTLFAAVLLALGISGSARAAQLTLTTHYEIVVPSAVSTQVYWPDSSAVALDIGVSPLSPTTCSYDVGFPATADDSQLLGAGELYAGLYGPPVSPIFVYCPTGAKVIVWVWR